MINTLKKNISKQKGFSLPELIIVIGIFVIISTVAMFNQGKLSSSVLLTNMAYEVGLAIREAQTYGIGVRSEDAGANFTGQYGAYFDTSSETSNRQVIVFADLDQNLSYTQGANPPEEKYIYEFENRRGNKITAMCVGDLAPGTACQNGVNSESPLSILVKRPNPSALIAPVSAGQPIRLERVYVVVSSLEEDDCRAVIVEPTGQIRVEDSSKGACTVVNP